MHAGFGHIGVVVLAAIARVCGAVNLDVAVRPVQDYLLGEGSDADNRRRRDRRRGIRGDSHLEKECDIDRIEAFVKRDWLNIQISGQDFHILALDTDCVINHRLRAVGEVDLKIGQAILVGTGIINPSGIYAYCFLKAVRPGCGNRGRLLLCHMNPPSNVLSCTQYIL